ncbi:Glutathione S-transferase U18 [Dendrobium catenatum]|uniref:glutathione transferase n=1 Tax=Dendrobium catenatum TaxID=906689 RepID=A0A2I0WB99_9ASPA|nr:Glutathione S-transferase U18 [Dendrobium catenatum]
MIALNLKGVEYEFLPDDLSNKSELLLNSNPVYKKVPVLIHGDKSICESLVIVQYIDHVWASSGPRILPVDPYDLAIVRFWAAYVDDKVRAVFLMKRNYLRTLRIYQLTSQIRVLILKEDEKSKAEAAEQLFTALLLLEEAFVKCSKGSFFGGDTINLLDITLGSCINWLKAMEIVTGINFLDKTKTPRLAEWAERFCSAEAAKEVLPEAEKLVEYIKFLRAANRAAAVSSSK